MLAGGGQLPAQAVRDVRRARYDQLLGDHARESAARSCGQTVADGQQELD
jgi:hypothetical protein